MITFHDLVKSPWFLSTEREAAYVLPDFYKELVKNGRIETIEEYNSDTHENIGFTIKDIPIDILDTLIKNETIYSSGFYKISFDYTMEVEKYSKNTIAAMLDSVIDHINLNSYDTIDWKTCLNKEFSDDVYIIDTRKITHVGIGITSDCPLRSETVGVIKGDLLSNYTDLPYGAQRLKSIELMDNIVLLKTLSTGVNFRVNNGLSLIDTSALPFLEKELIKFLSSLDIEAFGFSTETLKTTISDHYKSSVLNYKLTHYFNMSEEFSAELYGINSIYIIDFKEYDETFNRPFTIKRLTHIKPDATTEKEFKES